MNEDNQIQKIFRPFREAKAPEGFTDQVMARVNSAGAPKQWRVKMFGFGAVPGRWAWAGGLALAASVALMISPRQTPPTITKTDLSIYLADSNQEEEEAGLGTRIESYFL